MHRFFIEPEFWNVADLRLTGPEAHHCSNVLRLNAGSRITVFNGKGTEATVEIVSQGRDDVGLRLISESKSEPTDCHIILGQAIPKGKNMELIIQKSTELGVGEIAPIISERTVVRLDGDEALNRQTKWQTVTIEAAKQCGRNWIPAVQVPAPLKSVLGKYASDVDLAILASLQDDRRTFNELIAEFEENQGHKPRTVLILIGPEGDFTPAECAAARSAGCRPVTLGPIVLRTETAALYSLSVLGNTLF